MGVPWGFETSNSEFETREEFVAQWTAFAASGTCKRFTTMFDTDRYDFTFDKASGVKSVVTPDPALFAKIKKLPTRDGSYDLFSRFLDGEELFVPGSRGPTRMHAPGTRFDGRRAAGTGWLDAKTRWLNATLEEGTDPDYADLAKDKWLVALVREMLFASIVAKRHKLLIGISFG